MKDKKKLYIVSGIIAFIVIAIIFVLFINDKNKLTRSEKNWINDNMNVVQNIHVVNNVNVFGDNGTGVFYDFIQDLQTEYRLEINPVTFLYGEAATGNAFNAGPVIGKDATVFYEDHYAIVGKDKAIHTSSSDFIQSEIGVLALDSEYLKMVLPNYNFKVYESTDKLFEGLKNGDVSLIMISVLRDIDKVIENDFYVNYHFSDVKYYYYFDGAENNELASIVKKYFNNWKDKYFTEVFNSNEFVTITNALGLSEADISDILAKTYNYGFINQNPYEVITGGNFGGISAVYLKEFSKFSGVDFKFNKYSSFSKFIDAIGKQDIDIYLNFYTFDDKFQTTYTPQGINFDIIAPVKEKITIGSLNTPNEITVYTQKSSKIASYLANNSNYKIEYFETLKEMNRLAKKGKIIALDTEVFNYFHKNKLRNYESRLHMSINESYSFKTNTNNKFDKLLSAYISTLDPNIIKYTGIYNHNQTVLKGEILAKIAQYILLILSLLGLFMALFYKKSKKVTITKKIRNDEKIKYIDLLTSLKNRNYLTENMETWNNNTVYPQTMILIDLNHIAYLNDKKGYEAGDRQITALANILIKTQLDNSDIMRTNGNEFLIYLVGYQQKHIVNYIHKLTKEMKKLPYEYGAAIGYSMITDDIKTIEDAINEALEDMKKQKPKNKEV